MVPLILPFSALVRVRVSKALIRPVYLCRLFGRCVYCYIFKMNCPVFGQSIIVALSGGYILYYIFLVYLAGMKNVATTACVPCTVLITNGKRKSTGQTCVFTLYLLNCCPIVTLYSLVPRPPLLLPSVCVHNNTRKWSSAPVYYCER